MSKNKSAFPMHVTWSSGISLREYVATQILAGMSAWSVDKNQVVEKAIELADLLIEKLSKEGKE